MGSTQPSQVAEKVTIGAETIVEAALTKLGSNKYKIQFKETHDHKYFAILDIQIDSYPYSENSKKTTIYSYFHDTIQDAREDAYSEALTWLQSEVNLVIDSRANKQLEETQHKLKMSAGIAAVIEEKCARTAAEAARIRNHRELAMTEMIAAAEKIPGMLALAENTTPLKPTSTAHPHMVYIGQDPPRNEKEQLAECLCKVYTLLKLA